VVTSTHIRSSSGEFSKLKTAKTEVSKQFATAVQSTPRGSQNYVRRSATKLFSLRADGKKVMTQSRPHTYGAGKLPMCFSHSHKHTRSGS